MGYELNPKTEVGGSSRSGDAASPKGECAALGAFFPAARGGRVSNRRPGGAVTVCDWVVAATIMPFFPLLAAAADFGSAAAREPAARDSAISSRHPPALR